MSRMNRMSLMTGRMMAMMTTAVETRAMAEPILFDACTAAYGYRSDSQPLIELRMS